MRKLYNEFFYIPKQGKIREKVMIVRVAVSAVLMIICLASMSITAYAYFSNNVTSGSNIIKAANFEVNVSITPTGTDSNAVAVSEIQINENDNKTHTFNLEEGNTYKVMLTHAGTASTGFCVITITDGNCVKTYYTQQLGVDQSAEGGKTDSITFTLTVSNDTTVTILPHWGTSSCYDPYKNNTQNEELYICNGGKVNMLVAGQTYLISELDLGENLNPDEPTEDETTTTERIHTVAENETLSAIASKYGVSVERIVAYNGISDPGNIQVGQQLQIPPANWQMPADITEQTTTGSETTELEESESTEDPTTESSENNMSETEESECGGPEQED